MPRPAACKKVGGRRIPSNRSRARRTEQTASAKSNVFEEADQDQAGPSDARPSVSAPGPAVAGPSHAVSGAGHAAPARMIPGRGSPTSSVVRVTAHRVMKRSPTKSSEASLRSVLGGGRAGPSSSSRVVDPIVVHGSDSESDPNATQSDKDAGGSDVDIDDAATLVATGDTTSDEFTLVGSDESDQLGRGASDDGYHIDWDDDQDDDDYDDEHEDEDDGMSLFSSASADSSHSILHAENGAVIINVQSQPLQHPAPSPAPVPVPEDVVASLAPVAAASPAVADPPVFGLPPPSVPDLQATVPAPPAAPAGPPTVGPLVAGPPAAEPDNADPAVAIPLAGPTTVGPPASGPPVATDATVATVPTAGTSTPIAATPQAEIAAVASNALNIFHARLPENHFVYNPAYEERIARERRNQTRDFFRFVCQGNDSLFDNGGYGVYHLDFRNIVENGDLQLHFTRQSMSGAFVSLGVFRVSSAVLHRFSHAWQDLVSQHMEAANYVKHFDENFAQEIRDIAGQRAGSMGNTFVPQPNSSVARPVVMVRRCLEAYVRPPLHTDLPAQVPVHLADDARRVEAAQGGDETSPPRPCLVLENRADEESQHELPLPLPAVPINRAFHYKADFYAYVTVPLANACCSRHIYVPRSYSEELHLDGRINIDVTSQFSHFGRRFDNGTFTNVMEALLLIMHGRDDRVRRMYGRLATEIGIQLLADLDMVFLAERMQPHFFD